MNCGSKWYKHAAAYQTQSWQITSLIKTGSRLGCGQAGQFPLPVVHKYNTFPFRLYFLCIEQQKGLDRVCVKKGFKSDNECY